MHGRLRARLIERLDERRTSGVTLIFPPASFGKNTLVSEWDARGVRFNYQMTSTLSSNLKIDRKAFSVGSLTDPSDEKADWLTRTPSERLKQVEILRRINYGHRATARLQRVLEITERKRR